MVVVWALVAVAFQASRAPTPFVANLCSSPFVLLGVVVALLVRLVRADVFFSDNGQKITLNVYTNTGLSIKILVEVCLTYTS